MNEDSKKNESKFLNRQFYELEKQLKSTNQNTQFVPGGVSLRSAPVSINGKNIFSETSFSSLFSQFAITTPKSLNLIKPNLHEKSTMTSLKKILQRGDPSFLSPKIEAELLKYFNFDIEIEESKGDIAPKIISEKLTFDKERFDITGEVSPDSTPKIRDEEIHIFDSKPEENFYKLCAEKFPGSLKWLHPQPLRKHFLLSDFTQQEENENRRGADFLYAPPWQKSIIIEVLGPHWFAKGENQNSSSSSKKFLEYKSRFDTELVDVYGIPVSQIDARSGDDLENVLNLVTAPDGIETKTTANLLNTIWSIGALHNLFTEILSLEVLYGKKQWKIKINKFDSLLGFNHYLNLVKSISKVWNCENLLPQKILFFSESKNNLIYSFELEANQKYLSKKIKNESLIKEDIEIKIEPEKTYLETYEKSSIFYVRKSSFPFKHQTTISKTKKPKISLSSDNQKDLEEVLNHVFAKNKFRNIQFNALKRVLEEKNSLVLLPTGFGKSMIYQLASLILPGITLVISPTVALIKNQQKNMELNSISRAVGISGEDTPVIRNLKYESISQGNTFLILCSPERLLSSQFTEKLKTAVAHIGLSLNAIDEAHCISEWGQEFRTSYLGIGNRLNELTETKTPLLALTGTASLKVRQDITFNCQLSESDVLQADNFKRDELNFNVVFNTNHKEKPNLVNDFFETQIEKFFNSNLNEFFTTNQAIDRNNLIIIFVPYKKDTINYRNRLLKFFKQKEIDVSIGIMWGTKPFSNTDWINFIGKPKDENGKSIAKQTPKQTQREYKEHITENFRTGKTKIIIATKAFGMGIDIPNIRSVLHIGIPSSLMSWYQEAGRAGRDQENSLCTTIFTEEENVNPEELFNTHNAEVVQDIQKKLRTSDIWTHLQFYYNSFPGIYEELLYLIDFLRKLKDEFTWDATKPNKTTTIDFFGELIDIEKETDDNISEEKQKSIEEAERESETINNFIDKTVYRLLICGFLKNWHKDYSAQKYELEFNSINEILKFTELENWLKQRLHTTTKGFIDTVRLIGRGIFENNLSYSQVIDQFVTQLGSNSEKEIYTEENFDINDLRNLEEVIILAPSSPTSKQIEGIKKEIKHKHFQDYQIKVLEEFLESDFLTSEVCKSIKNFLHQTRNHAVFTREKLTIPASENQKNAIKNIIKSTQIREFRNEFKSFIPKNMNEVDWFFLRKLIHEQAFNSEYRQKVEIQQSIENFQKKASGFDAFIICIFTYLVIATYDSIGYQKRASHLDVYRYAKNFNSNEEIQNFFNSFFGDSDDVFAAKLRNDLINPLQKDKITMKDWIEALQNTPNINSVIFDIEKGRDTADQFSLWWIGYLYVLEKSEESIERIHSHLDEYKSLHNDALENVFEFLKNFTNKEEDLSFIASALNWYESNLENNQLRTIEYTEFYEEVLNKILEKKLFDDATLLLINNSVIDKLKILKNEFGLIGNNIE